MASGFFVCIFMQPHGLLFDQAQENPDFDEQPERAPAGIELLPEDILKLDAEIVFLMFLLLHFVQVTLLIAFDEVTNASNGFLHSWQRNS